MSNSVFTFNQVLWIVVCWIWFRAGKSKGRNALTKEILDQMDKDKLLDPLFDYMHNLHRMLTGVLDVLSGEKK